MLRPPRNAAVVSDRVILRQSLLAVLLLSLACESDAVVEAVGDAQLTVSVVLAGNTTSQRIDQGRITLQGPTNRTVTVAPGTTETITGLLPGSYTVLLEGLTAGDVELYGEQGGINVVAGSNTPVSMTVSSFVPVLGAVPATAEAGKDMAVQYSAVGGASGYAVEWDSDPAFSNPHVEPTTTSTTTTMRPTLAGQIHVRVRAFSRLGSRSRPSTPATVNVPPLSTGLLSLAWIHGCALRGTTMSCWGSNSNSVVGPGATSLYQNRPVPVPGTYKFVAAGLGQTCGLDPSGHAWCWGTNNFGGLGDGTQTRQTSPVAAASALTFTELSVGAFHSCGLTANGEIWCWGGYTSAYPILGNGSTGFSLVPVKVSAPAGVVFTSVSAGTLTTCGLSTTGDAYCWGSNVSGQVGDGTTNNAPVPVLVAGNHKFRSIEVGNVNNFLHPTCAVDVDGAAWCWGLNNDGQIGSGSSPDVCTFNTIDYDCVTTPQPVQGGLKFDRVVPGYDHTCGEVRGGRVACWGANGFGQLGDASRTGRISPAELSLPAGIGRLGVGQRFACWITPTTLDCWGDSSVGQVGTGIDGYVTAPTTVPGSGWQGLSANPCAVSAAGAVSCWGPVINSTADPPILSSNVTAIGGPALHDISGLGFACGLDAAGAAWCWGSNGVGLGDGSTTSSRAPVQVAGGLTFLSVSAGSGHACGIESGTRFLWCWGFNGQGNLGDNTGVNSPVPVRVASNLAFAFVSAGGNSTCASTFSGGDVWCWGRGFNGNLGIQVTTPPYTVLAPVLVPGVTGVTRLSAGSVHTCAIQGGGVVCWGLSSSGQLGVTGTGSPNGDPPVTVPGLSGVTRLAVNGSTSCAVTAGNVVCWGLNTNEPPGAQSSGPTLRTVPGIPGAIDVVNGGAICVLATGGIVYCWGNNNSGAVGAPLPHVLSPARVAL